MATLRTSWLNEPLPPQILEDSSWMRIVHFFLIESPCPGQSNRKNNDIDKWAPAPWVGTRSLKTSLNQAIFSRRDVDVMLSVGSKKELEGACKKLNLDELFYENVDDQRMVFVKVNSKGNTSKYMSLFYHIRNALAHGRFAFKTDSLERFVFIFEDGTVASDCKKFNLTARGVIRLNSLILAIDTIQKGPGKTVDIEEKILAAISEGVNTRRKIKGELGITGKDWCIYSQVLKRRKNRMQPAEMVHLQRGINCQWVEPVAPSAAISRSVASIISCRSSCLSFASMALLTPVCRHHWSSGGGEARRPLFGDRDWSKSFDY